MVLGISQDDDPDAYQKFLIEHGVNFPTYRDPAKKIPGAVRHGDDSRGLPDQQDGKIARKIVGPQDWTSPELRSASKRCCA